MNRILVIRGGAIGDFILTLPAMRALRDANPKAHIEILGYTHIAELASNRFYANRVRSIEYAPLSRFFAKDSEISEELAGYFEAFDLVISYLYDPDSIFENNLRRCGVRHVVLGRGKLEQHKHAAEQLAEPIESLGIEVSDLAPKFFPSPADQHFAQEFLCDQARPLLAFHPGSGSERKNWPLQNWIELGNRLLAIERFGGSILVIGGEADDVQMAKLQAVWSKPRVRFAKGLALPHLGALLQDSVFVGHDSGISHLAAAAGARCVLLFGPTDPDVWAPRGENVHVIRASDETMDRIALPEVEKAVRSRVLKQGQAIPA
jgi:heptosyltransferase-2